MTGTLVKIFILSSLLLAAVHYFLIDISSADFWKVYSESFRDNIFTSFLTLSAFLFSLKTFIIMKMKESVYDSPRYVEEHNKAKQIDVDKSLYAPLKNLSNLLHYTIVFAILTAFTQLSFGLVNEWWAMFTCMILCFYTLMLFVYDLLLIKANLDTWFKYIEEDKNL